MAADGTTLADWIGRTEERCDTVSPSALARLAATLDRPPPGAGDPLPPLWHWLHFLPEEPMAALGPDGHARRGGFLPPVHDLTRRMWAGSRLAFGLPPAPGAEVLRRSTIARVEEKAGQAGRLVFVTVRHEVREAATPDGPPAVTDEHDIVYRNPGPAAPAAPLPEGATVTRRLVPDPVLLFRFSALTFNGHRIHYDRDWATAAEGYPGLVVHGPLVATLLLDLLAREAPGARVARFAFRARSPAIADEPLDLAARPHPGGATLWAAGPRGLVMTAEAAFDPTEPP